MHIKREMLHAITSTPKPYMHPVPRKKISGLVLKIQCLFVECKRGHEGTADQAGGCTACEVNKYNQVAGNSLTCSACDATTETTNRLTGQSACGKKLANNTKTMGKWETFFSVNTMKQTDAWFCV